MCAHNYSKYSDKTWCNNAIIVNRTQLRKRYKRRVWLWFLSYEINSYHRRHRDILMTCACNYSKYS